MLFEVKQDTQLHPNSNVLTLQCRPSKDFDSVDPNKGEASPTLSTIQFFCVLKS